jgi:hypothetical protein
MISKEKFREAMTIVEQYTAQLDLASVGGSTVNTYEIGCKVKLSKWGKEMQNPHNLTGKVIDYLPYMYKGDGCVTVKWEGKSKPESMHISQVEAVK